ncbi:MAG: hypothetical protein KAW09_08195, partial [Thermoplasmata archaeon]|nr:hypothetical protein [Thermoplasmata archaeon]
MEAGVISALFHDICYPVEQSIDIFKNTSQALSDCYSVFGIKNIVWDYGLVLEHKNALKRIESDLSDIIEENVKKANKDWRESISHAILGSTQYLDLQRETQRTKNPTTVNAIRSILLHDSKLVNADLQTSFVEKPLPSLLILSDELQEWGRPVTDIEEIPIPEVDLRVEKKEDSLVIEATFDHTNFSRERNGLTNRLRPFASKFRSLRRIVFDGNVHIILRFILSKQPDFYTKLDNRIELQYKLKEGSRSILLDSNDSVFFSKESEEVMVLKNTVDLREIMEVTIQSVVNPSSRGENLVAAIKSGGTSIRFKDVVPVHPYDESVDIFSESGADNYKCSTLVIFDKREDAPQDSSQEVEL